MAMGGKVENARGKERRSKARHRDVEEVSGSEYRVSDRSRMDAMDECQGFLGPRSTIHKLTCCNRIVHLECPYRYLLGKAAIADVGQPKG